MKSAAFLVAALLTATVVWGADPMIGTWQVNIAKSKYAPGPPPERNTAVHSEDGGFIVSKTEGVDAKGRPFGSSYRWKKDGQDYAVTGARNFDALAAKRVNDRTTDFTYKRGGKVVATAHVVVSKDGKVATLTYKGTDAEGKPLHNRIILERQ